MYEIIAGAIEVSLQFVCTMTMLAVCDTCIDVCFQPKF